MSNKNRKFWNNVILVGLLLSSFIIFSCAGARSDSLATESDDDADIFAELAGESEAADPGYDDAVDDEEAEVMRLLGLDSEEDSAMDMANDMSDNPVIAQSDNSLQDRSKEKDAELLDLKVKIAERDKRIAELEGQIGNVAAQKPAPVANTFAAKYQDALSSYRNRQYKTSITKFNNLLAAGSANSLVDNCQYWKGECYYALANYDQAIIEFQKVFIYSKSNKLDDAQLKLGRCYQMMGNIERARTEFQNLINDYPESEYISRAQQYLAQL